jgi:hypothetical protein
MLFAIKGLFDNPFKQRPIFPLKCKALTKVAAGYKKMNSPCIKIHPQSIKILTSN